MYLAECKHSLSKHGIVLKPPNRHPIASLTAAASTQCDMRPCAIVLPCVPHCRTAADSGEEIQHPGLSLCLCQLVVGCALQAKVPYLTAPGLAVAFLAKFCTHKLGFDIHKFW